MKIQCLGLNTGNRKKNEPSACAVSGEGLTSAIAGKPAKFLVRTKTPDLVGLDVDIARIITDSTSDIAAVSIPLEFECVEENLHSVTYQPQKEGNYLLAITWKGNHVTGSPYNVKVAENTDFEEDQEEDIWKKMDETEQ
ncbi:hypothetical protein QZH41_001262 [Actinostola sp. cb2023]|nr:hypothetical protein QZH41_001262 [Actinostola sp. cb2023]